MAILNETYRVFCEQSNLSIFPLARSQRKGDNRDGVEKSPAGCYIYIYNMSSREWTRMLYIAYGILLHLNVHVYRQY